MTLPTTVSRVQYLPNGVTTAFAVPFLFLADSHIIVTETSATGVDTLKVLTTDYTLSGVGDPGGGTVTMLVAPVSGTRLTIERIVPLNQLVDYIPNDAFPAETHESALDFLTMVTQQLQDGLDRAIMFPSTEAVGSSPELPDVATRANNILSFDVNGAFAVIVELGKYRELFVAARLYNERDMVSDPITGDIFWVPAQYTSGATVAIDVAAGDLQLLLSNTATAGAVAAQVAAEAAQLAAETAQTAAELAEANAVAAAASIGAPGTELFWSRDTPPTGWFIEDGADIVIGTFEAIYDVIGNTYGLGVGANFTADSGTDTFTDVAHGLVDNDIIEFTNSGGALPTGSGSSTKYFIISAVADTFQISLAQGGIAVAISDNGSGTHSWHDEISLPDPRGRFIRIGDEGASVDPDAASRTDRGDGVIGDNVGTNQDEEFKSHTHDIIAMTNGVNGNVQGQKNNTPQITDTTQPAGGSETRPVNTYRNMIIKF